MQLHELACSYMTLHAVIWACMQLHELTCSYMACMQLHELACSYMSLHAVTWACMQFPELACSSFHRLCSSQEFCSACLYRIKVQMHWCWCAAFCIYSGFFCSKHNIERWDWIQGVRLEWSKNFCLLVLNYKCLSLLEHTERSTDVVHLIIYTS